MLYTLYESHLFVLVREDLFQGDDNFRRFQNALMANPRAGDVIPGTNGARKVRWGDNRRGKGKSGGIRVIYYYHHEMNRLVFLIGYDKNKQDLTESQKRWCAEYIAEFQLWREQKRER